MCRTLTTSGPRLTRPASGLTACGRCPRAWECLAAGARSLANAPRKPFTRGAKASTCTPKPLTRTPKPLTRGAKASTRSRKPFRRTAQAFRRDGTPSSRDRTLAGHRCRAWLAGRCRQVRLAGSCRRWHKPSPAHAAAAPALAAVRPAYGRRRAACGPLCNESCGCSGCAVRQEAPKESPHVHPDPAPAAGAARAGAR